MLGAACIRFWRSTLHRLHRRSGDFHKNFKLMNDFQQQAFRLNRREMHRLHAPMTRFRSIEVQHCRWCRHGTYIVMVSFGQGSAQMGQLLLSLTVLVPQRKLAACSHDMHPQSVSANPAGRNWMRSSIGITLQVPRCKLAVCSCGRHPSSVAANSAGKKRMRSSKWTALQNYPVAAALHSDGWLGFMP